jgi:hypothetical protein
MLQEDAIEDALVQGVPPSSLPPAVVAKPGETASPRTSLSLPAPPALDVGDSRLSRGAAELFTPRSRGPSLSPSDAAAPHLFPAEQASRRSRGPSLSDAVAPGFPAIRNSRADSPATPPALAPVGSAPVGSADSVDTAGAIESRRSSAASTTNAPSAAAAPAPAPEVACPSFTSEEVELLKASSAFADFGEAHERGLAYMRWRRDEAVAASGGAAPSAEFASDVRLLRVFIACGWDCQAAAEMYVEALTWRSAAVRARTPRQHSAGGRDRGRLSARRLLRTPCDPSAFACCSRLARARRGQRGARHGRGARRGGRAERRLLPRRRRRAARRLRGRARRGGAAGAAAHLHATAAGRRGARAAARPTGAVTPAAHPRCPPPLPSPQPRCPPPASTSRSSE